MEKLSSASLRKNLFLFLFLFCINYERTENAAPGALRHLQDLILPIPPARGDPGSSSLPLDNTSYQRVIINVIINVIIIAVPGGCSLSSALPRCGTDGGGAPAALGGGGQAAGAVLGAGEAPPEAEGQEGATSPG